MEEIQAPKNLKIIIIGDQGVGKTSLITSLLNQDNYTKPTIGTDIFNHQIDLGLGDVVKIQICDTAGQERFQSLCANYYRDSNCCIIVYDVSDQSSYENTEKWLINFAQNAPDPDVPFILVGNKIDHGVEVDQEIVEQEWIQTQRACVHFLTSTRTKQNVNMMFKVAAQLAKQHFRKINQEIFTKVHHSFTEYTKSSQKNSVTETCFKLERKSHISQNSKQTQQNLSQNALPQESDTATQTYCCF